MELHIWSFDPAMLEAGELDVDGYEVEARDGKVGTVESVEINPQGAFIVLNTGPWILGRTIVVPAGIVERIDRERRKLFVGATRAAVEATPQSSVPIQDDEMFTIGAHYNRSP